ncbi:MAG TPA: DUF2911 domain-containing protein [Puia sp.]|nr:DUF2911 domain-containing protein [Puia sp.]
MKNTLLLLSSFFFFGLLATAQPSHPNSPHDTLRTKDLTVTYGRPSTKGREIFGKLEPYGKVYRCGADEATTITFAKDGKFGGKDIKAGKYSLFVIPEATKWTIILNSEPKQWGAYDYEKNKSKDVLHVDVPVTNLSSTVEKLTIDAPGKDLTIAWDKTKVAIPLSF